MRKLLLVFLAMIFVLSACAAPYVAPPAPSAEQAQKEAAEQLSNEAREASNSTGPSIEARNIAERIKRSNIPGHVGFIYFISPYTGEIILKATFVGKPTSTSKRLDPSQSYEVINNVDCGDVYCTTFLEYEAVAADGTWGSSMPGIYWFTTDGQLMESRGDAAIVLVLERPYVFADNKVDMTVDVRLQSDLVDANLESQAKAVEKYIASTPGWEVGDPIPLEAMKGTK